MSKQSKKKADEPGKPIESKFHNSNSKVVTLGGAYVDEKSYASIRPSLRHMRNQRCRPIYSGNELGFRLVQHRV